MHGPGVYVDRLSSHEIIYFDNDNFFINCEEPIILDGIQLKSKVYKFNVSNPVGDKLNGLACLWTKACCTGSRKHKSLKQFKDRKIFTPFFRTLPVYSCTVSSNRAVNGSSTTTKLESVFVNYRVCEGAGNHSLRESVEMNLRISEKNIMKWVFQLLEMVLTYHKQCVCLNEFTIDDFLLTSDKSVQLIYSAGTSFSPIKSPPPGDNVDMGSVTSSISNGSGKSVRITSPNAPPVAASRGSMSQQSNKKSDLRTDSETSSKNSKNVPDVVVIAPIKKQKSINTINKQFNEVASLASRESAGASNSSHGAEKASDSLNSRTKDGSKNSKSSKTPLLPVEPPEEPVVTDEDIVRHTRDIWFNPRRWFQIACKELDSHAVEITASPVPSAGSSLSKSSFRKVRSSSNANAYAAQLPSLLSVAASSRNVSPTNSSLNSGRQHNGTNTGSGSNHSRGGSAGLSSKSSRATSFPITVTTTLGEGSFAPDSSICSQSSMETCGCSVISNVDHVEGDTSALPVTYPELASLEKNAAGAIMIPEVDREFFHPLCNKFSKGCWDDMRCLGVIVVQLCCRRCFNREEYRKFRNRDAFGIKDVGDVLYLRRLPETLRMLLEICFREYEYDELKIGRNISGGKTLSTQTAFARKLNKLYYKMKVDVQSLYHDFAPPMPKEPFWTEKDEELRLRAEAFEEQRKKELVKKAQSDACDRVNESRKKLWFELQPKKVQMKILRAQKFRRISEANMKERARLIHLASFHRWKTDDQRRWLQSSIYSILQKAKDMKYQSTQRNLDLMAQAFIANCYDPIKASAAKILVRFGFQCNSHKDDATPEELNQDIMQAMKTFTTEISAHLVKRFNNRVLYRNIEAAIRATATKMQNSNILSILPPDQYVLKKNALEADWLVQNFTRLRDAVKLFANDIVHVSREYTNKITLLVSICIIERHHADEAIRLEGAHWAAKRIVALFYSMRAKFAVQERREIRLMETDLKNRALVEQGLKDKQKQEAELHEKYLQELREKELAIIRESKKVAIDGHTVVPGGVDIVLSMNLGVTTFGNAKRDKCYMTAISKLVTPAVYRSDAVHPAKDLIIVPAYTSTKFPPIKAASSAENFESNSISNLKIEKPFEASATEKDDHVSTTGEINITLTDARIPLSKSDRDFSQRDWNGVGVKPEKISVELEFMGAKDAKWDRAATRKKRDENQHNYEKMMKTVGKSDEEEIDDIPEVDGMECFRFCVRGLRAGCTYKINLSMIDAFGPPKKQSDYDAFVQMQKGTKNTRIPVNPPLKVVSLPAAPDAPTNVCTRKINMQYPEKNCNNRSVIGPSADRHTLSVVDDLHHVATLPNCIDLEEERVANGSRKHRIEVTWCRAIDNGAPTLHYYVYRAISFHKRLGTPSKEAVRMGTGRSSSGSRPTTPGSGRSTVEESLMNAEYALEDSDFEYALDHEDKDVIYWKRVARVKGLQYHDIFDELTLFGAQDPHQPESQYVSVYYRVVASNKCGRSKPSIRSSGIHIEKELQIKTEIGEMDVAPGVDALEQKEKRRFLMATLEEEIAAGRLGIEGDFVSLPLCEGGKESPVTSNLNNHDSPLSQRSKMSSERDKKNQSSNKLEASDQAKSIVDMFFCQSPSIKGMSVFEENKSKVDIPVQWVDNMKPYTANKVSKTFYRDAVPGVKNLDMAPLAEMNDQLIAQGATGELNIDRWLEDLSLSCPLKPIDNSVEIANKISKAAASIRVGDEKPLNSMLLGKTIREMKQENKNKKKVRKR